MDVLIKLRDNGNSIIVIEHSMEVIKIADYIIDLGPEGGDAGGQVVAEGSPSDIAFNPASYTGQYLKQYFSEFQQANLIKSKLSPRKKAESV